MERLVERSYTIVSEELHVNVPQVGKFNFLTYLSDFATYLSDHPTLCVIGCSIIVVISIWGIFHILITYYYPMSYKEAIYGILKYLSSQIKMVVLKILKIFY